MKITYDIWASCHMAASMLMVHNYHEHNAGPWTLAAGIAVALWGFFGWDIYNRRR